MRHIRLSLSASSIDAAIAKVKSYSSSLQPRCREACEELCASGEQHAKDAISGYDMPFATGELLSSVRHSSDTFGGEVYTECGHAAFVEFGTGAAGAGRPYRGPLPGWSYDVNGHGEAGWVYTGDDGELHWTRGMPSRPFMLTAAEAMREEAADKFRSAFK